MSFSTYHRRGTGRTGLAMSKVPGGYSCTGNKAFDPKALAILCLFLLMSIFLYGLALLSSWENGLRLFNWTLPILLMIVSLWAIYRVVRSAPATLWTPFLWFLVSSAVYCGFGPLIYTFGTTEAIAALDSIFPVDAQTLCRTNLLNTVAILAITAVFFRVFSYLETKKPLPNSTSFTMSPSQAKSISLYLLAIGIPVKYFLALPHEFGRLGFALPGTLYHLEGCMAAAFIFLAYAAATCGRKWVFIFIAIFGFEMGIELLRFDKSTLLLRCIFAMIGFYLARRNMWILFIGVIVTLGFYLVLSPVVGVARNEIIFRYGGRAYEATLTQRLAIWRDGIPIEGIFESSCDSKLQRWWTRICHANFQAFVMDEYEAGRGGHTLSDASWTLVPSFMWPDKPDMNRLGVDFGEFVLKHGGTSLAMTVYAEGYWNGGWPLVLGFGIYIGMLLALLSWLALKIVINQKFLFLPCILIGMRIGTRTEGYFVADYVGTVVIYFGLMAVIWGLFGPKGLLSRRYR